MTRRADDFRLADVIPKQPGTARYQRNIEILTGYAHGARQFVIASGSEAILSYNDDQDFHFYDTAPDWIATAWPRDDGAHFNAHF